MLVTSKCRHEAKTGTAPTGPLAAGSAGRCTPRTDGPPNVRRDRLTNWCPINLGRNSKIQDEERKKPTSFQAFVYQDFLIKYCDWSETTRKGNGSRLKMLCVEWGRRPLSSITARDIKT
jgi:hypothetical protein